VETYQKPVYNFCYRMLNEPEAAEDAAQETFLRAYQHLPGYNPQRPFATWLLSIAAHHCIDQLRRRRFVSFSIDTNETQETCLPDRTVPDPEEETFRRLECEHLHSLLQALEPIQRSILVLHYWQGTSEQEIARMLHLSAPAVKSRLHRARLALARLWEEKSKNMHIREIDHVHQQLALQNS
jgi:RNA polymerase sigma-70 factor (ECF subfamily)